MIPELNILVDQIGIKINGVLEKNFMGINWQENQYSLARDEEEGWLVRFIRFLFFWIR